LYDAEPDGEDPWRRRPTLDSAGFGGSDVVLNAFAYHLTPAAAMFEEARRQLGAIVLPGGWATSTPRRRSCAALGVTAYVGLPSSTTKTPVIELCDFVASDGRLQPNPGRRRRG
jgi:phenylacetate-CoA ligase